MIYRRFFRPLLFLLDPERVHNLTLAAARFSGSHPGINGLVRRNFNAHSQSRNPIEVCGLKFPNPVGLAAGYDKDGIAWRGLAALGFGHVEVGTVTPKPQVGNPKPRIFRIPAEDAVINRMGFPGRGADYVAHQLEKSLPDKPDIILGVNIGKNKATPNQEAALDYVHLLRKFSPLADYLVVNVSSPNTVGLRRLQAKNFLEDLLAQLWKERLELEHQVPIFVKIAPDLTNEELDDVLDAVINTGFEGVIATNTTISRHTLHSNIGREMGGLSGAPLTEISRKMVAEIFQRTSGKLPIIGVGGIMRPDNVKAMLAAGASLVQVYTGLIYRGPGFVREILVSL